jgi:hypothetical protein
VITTSSPLRARSISSERLFLASTTLCLGMRKNSSLIAILSTRSSRTCCGPGGI